MTNIQISLVFGVIFGLRMMVFLIWTKNTSSHVKQASYLCTWIPKDLPNVVSTFSNGFKTQKELHSINIIQLRIATVMYHDLYCINYTKGMKAIKHRLCAHFKAAYPVNTKIAVIPKWALLTEMTVILHQNGRYV